MSVGANSMKCEEARERTYRELTLPVVLASSGNLPFSILVWSYVLSSSYGKASAAALIMLVLMVPFLLAYWLIAWRVGLLPSPLAAASGSGTR